MKKISFSLKTALLTASLITSTLVWADPKTDPTPTPTPDTNAIVAAINNLGKKMEALTTAGVKAVNNAAYQIDKNLPNLSQVNQEKNNLDQQAPSRC